MLIFHAEAQLSGHAPRFGPEVKNRRVTNGSLVEGLEIDSEKAETN